MKKWGSLLLLIIVVFASAPVWAKRHKVKKATNLRLVEAYYQKMVPGIPGAPTKTNYTFIIRWEGKKYPETFFWRGENGWLACNMLKAHKVNSTNKHMPSAYRTEFVVSGAIHKGDTLQLTPVSGGKFPIPAEIPADARNTLFYKTGGSAWLAFPINKIEHRQDIVAP